MAPTDTVDVVGTVEVVARLRRAYADGVTRPVGWRRRQLQALRRLITEQRTALHAALHADLHKSEPESDVTELSLVIGEIDHVLRHLDRWLRPQRVAVPPQVWPADARVLREPLGVVAVIAPWNYPIQLSLVPMVGALAAGNAVVLKPSELAPATAAALADLLPRYLDERAVAVVRGGADETTELLAQPLDHVFFTGGQRVGSIIAAEAGRRLIPVTLELGGKSPVWVDRSTDLPRSARRIAWGKFANAGQTCIAPDYVLATPTVAAELEPLLVSAIAELYGDDPAAGPDFGRIVNEAQFDRLVGLLGSGRVVTGGVTDRDTRYLAPTVIADVAPDSPVMAEEIFGPILPILTVPDRDAAIAFVTARPKPLVLYAFGTDPEMRTAFTDRTSSGALCFDVPLAHSAVPDLPFGGVGASGTGSYHGERSIITFSHEKAVLDKPLFPDTLGLIYPPFTRTRRAIMRRLFPR